MKVLMTGGCGFIGSHTAELACRKGHTVFIIDNLVSGTPSNLSVKLPLAETNIIDPVCESLFKDFLPDAVIHLAAQTNVNVSMEHPYLDTSSNILGLVNMLSLSAKYGVGKFIFASSAAVYGNNPAVPLKEEYASDPVSPYGISKSVGELYCRKWMEIYGLKTLCFRFSNVYGPRQGNGGEGGVVSIFMNRMLRKQELTVFGDGNQTRDFIYVADIAEALTGCLKDDITGVFNLSTNTESSVNDLIGLISSMQPPVGVIYSEIRPGDIIRSRLDNSRFKSRTGWRPRYTFSEGIQDTFNWFQENKGD